MRPKSLLLLALALCCGLVASIGISQVMDRNKAVATAPAIATTQIYVALTDIPVGDKITAGMLQLEDWPTDKVQPTAITRLEDVVGRVPRTLIVRGDPILTTKLISGELHDDPSGMLPKGYRAFPVKLGIEDSTAGLARVGDRVDVHWYVHKNPTLGIESTKIVTMLQNIKIFAINQTVTRPADNSNRKAVVATTIALQVTPKQTKMLNLAKTAGAIKLVLRNPEDDAEDTNDSVDFHQLITELNVIADKDAERNITGGDAGDEPPSPMTGIANSLLDVMRTSSQPVSADWQDEWYVTMVRGTQVTRELVGAPNHAGPLPSGLPGQPGSQGPQSGAGLPGVDLPPVDGPDPTADGGGDFSFDSSDFAD